MGIASWWQARQAAKWSAISAMVEQGHNSARSTPPRFNGYISFGMIDQPVPLSVESSDLPTLLCAASWSYAAVTATARQVAALQPIVQRRGRTGEERWVRDDDHELNALLEHPHGPNPEPPNWSWGQFVETAMIHLQLAQRGAVIYVDKLANTPIRLFLLTPTGVTPRENSITGLADSWYYGSSNYRPDQIVQVVLPHPSSYTLSMPPLQAALKAVGIDRQAESRQLANLTQKVSPGTIFAISGMTGLDQEMIDEQELAIQKKFAKAEQDGKVMVVGEGTTMLAPPLTIAQIGYETTRRMAAEQFLAAFLMPPQVIGLKPGTVEEIAESRLIWYDLSIFPYLGILYGALNRQLVDRSYANDKVRIWYDLADSPIALALMMGKVAGAQAIVDLGYPPEIAAKHVGLGLPHVDGLDQPQQPQIIAGRLPADGTKPTPKTTPITEDDPEEAQA
jgi:hypothetical protein